MAVLTKPAAKKRERITNELRSLALRMSPGERFLSSPEICRFYDASPGTVEAAVKTLRQEGLITRRRGSGTFISGPTENRLPKTRSNVLAVLGGCAGAYQLPYVRAVQDALMEYGECHNKRIVQHFAGYNPQEKDLAIDVEVTIGYARNMEVFHPFGYLLLFYHQVPVARDLIQRGHSVVVLGVPPAGVVPDVPCVYGDHELGGYSATRHLIEQGHQHIGFVFGFHDIEIVRMSRRWQGYCRALREIGTEPRPVGPDLYHPEGDGFQQALEGPSGLTALVLWTDALYVALIPVLEKNGVRVPEDLSLIGYDNTPLPEFPHPLDSVDQHISRQVAAAVALVDADDGTSSLGTAPSVVVLPHVVSRGSVTKPRR